MSLLRFRLKFDDYDDVHRDIDIKSDQSFADLLKCALDSVGFDDKHEATFFMADHNWRKSGTIGNLRLDSKGKLQNLKLVAQIDDPHQKFLLEYDLEKRWQFTLELIKIMPVSNLKATYPSIYSAVGIAPVQYVEAIVIPVRERPRKSNVKDDDDAIFEEDFLEADLADDTSDELDIADTEVEGAEAEGVADLPENFEVESDDEIEKNKDEMSGNFIETSDDSDENEFGDYGSDDDEYGMGGDDDEYGSYSSRNDYDE